MFALGALLRGLFGQQQQNPVVIVASTLVIAALFQPLRHGLQRVIDRRFYRSKYDAATILTNFSTTLRSEIDLGQLSDHLVYGCAGDFAAHLYLTMAAQTAAAHVLVESEASPIT